MAKKNQKMNQYEILDAIIVESEAGENKFLKIFTDIFGGSISFNDKAGLYVWNESKPSKTVPIGKRQYDVEIEIRGGVADLVKKVPGVTVQIRDYDNEEGGDKFEDSNYDEHESIGAL
jgi:hypothetical protein